MPSKTGETGSAVLELAVASVVIMGMILGMYQMFMALYTYHYISEAAREASRYAIVRGSTSCVNTPTLSNCNATASEVQNFVRDQGFPGIDSTHYMTVNVSWLTVSTTQPATWSACSSGTCNAPGNIVKVQVQYAFPMALPFFSFSTLNLTSTSQMVIAQ
jgi:Flp pilus assembly protein TadG